MVKTMAVSLLNQLLIAVVARSKEVFLLDYLLTLSVTNDLQSQTVECTNLWNDSRI